MKITFTYEKQKDIWCIMNYGNGSINSNIPTATYKKLVHSYGENFSEKDVSEFIDIYLRENKIDVEKYVTDYQNEWDKIATIFHEKACSIFDVNLENDITVYLSINDRCPYNIEESYFFVSVPADSMRKIVMHELWHFYTWYRFGSYQEKLGKEKYNKIKEALTVLLNVEHKDILCEIQDIGYPQHQKLRTKILEIWNKHRDIGNLWNQIIVD